MTLIATSLVGGAASAAAHENTFGVVHLSTGRLAEADLKPPTAREKP